MLIQIPEAPGPKYPRLNYVLGRLERTFRIHPHKADPESRRNNFVAMCRKCTWERDHEDSRIATEAAERHERAAHGVLDGGLVRVECR